MTAEWVEVLLEDVAELNGGYAFKSEEYTNTGHFVLRTLNITEDGRITKKGATFISEASAKTYERFALKPLDSLFVMVGATLGKVGLVKDTDLPALLNQNMWVIRKKRSDTDPLFLHYAFSFYSKPLCSLVSGSARGFVKRDDFRRMKLWLPTLKAQKKISSLLAGLDDRITLLRETNITLEAIAQAAFKSWFVDFDPVRAKQEGRQPEGMDEATAALFPDTFETTELGELPTAWRISNIGAELTSILGGTPSRARPEFWKEGTVAWINSGKVNEFRITTASELITDEALSRSATKLLPARTTVLAITGATLGQISIVEIAACANQSVIGILQNEKFSTEFIYFWINFNIKKLIASQTGGAQQHINKGNVEELPLIVPDIQILNRFKSIAQPLFFKIAENCFQISTLSSIRDSLLPRLISGQIRLPDYEEQIGTATT